MSVSFTAYPGAIEGPNFSNVNSKALLDAMSLPSDAFGLCGDVDIPGARRGIIRARNRRSLATFTRAEINEPRCYSPAFEEDDLRERIERFAVFVEDAARRGATSITWG